MIGLLDNKMIREENIVPIEKHLVKNPWDLDVFKCAYEVSLEIHKTSLTFPKIEQYAVADQLRRASKSICANVSEGFIRQKYSKTEFARFVAIAESSACEVRIWLRYALDLQYVSQQQFSAWDEAYERITAMLAKLKTKLG